MMNALIARMREWSLRHLARPQPAQVFVPQIDGLRCVAICSVIFYHMQGYIAAAIGQPHPGTLLHRLFAEGAFGVPLFFSLSGYIITMPFLGPKPPTLRRYLLRRVTRLEPPYFINLLLVFAMKVAVLGMAAGALFPHLLASFGYMHNAVYGEHSLVNGVAWSLEVEWQFYLLAPLLLLLIVRLPSGWRHVGLWGLILAGGFVFASGHALPNALALSVLCYFGYFVAGVWVATCDARWPRASGTWLHDVLGVAAAVLILWILLQARGQFLLPVLVALLLFAALRGPLLKAVLGWWPIHCIGAMCYSIYLYHFFVVSMVGKIIHRVAGWPVDPDHAMWLMAGVGLPLVLAACVVPYLLIERPFMIWRPGRTRLVDAFAFGKRTA